MLWRHKDWTMSTAELMKSHNCFGSFGDKYKNLMRLKQLGSLLNNTSLIISRLYNFVMSYFIWFFQKVTVCMCGALVYLAKDPKCNRVQNHLKFLWPYLGKMNSEKQWKSLTYPVESLNFLHWQVCCYYFCCMLSS